MGSITPCTLHVHIEDAASCGYVRSHCHMCLDAYSTTAALSGLV